MIIKDRVLTKELVERGYVVYSLTHKKDLKIIELKFYLRVDGQTIPTMFINFDESKLESHMDFVLNGANNCIKNHAEALENITKNRDKNG